MHKRLRVLTVVGSAARLGTNARPVAVTGAERFAFDLTVALEASVEPIWAYPPEGALGAELRAADVRTIPWSHTQRGWWLRLIAIARQVSPDVIHSHADRTDVAAKLAAWASGAAHVATRHVPEYVEATRWGRALTLWDRVQLATGTRLVAISEVGRDYLRAKLGARADIARIPVGIPHVELDERVERASIRGEFGLAEDALVGITVSGMRVEKRVDRLLTVLREVPVEVRGQWLLVGDGPMRERWQREFAEVAGVHWLGQRADVPALLCAADVIALASDAEGTPIALMEAAQRGVPAIAEDIGAVCEVVDAGVTGLIVPRGDLAAWRDALMMLCGDAALRQRMGAAARLRAERFAIATCADAYRALYVALTAEDAEDAEDRRGNP